MILCQMKLLKPKEEYLIEFPHVLICFENQFDTIYHEHYSYLNLIFKEFGS